MSAPARGASRYGAHRCVSLRIVMDDNAIIMYRTVEFLPSGFAVGFATRTAAVARTGPAPERAAAMVWLNGSKRAQPVVEPLAPGGPPSRVR